MGNVNYPSIFFILFDILQYPFMQKAFLVSAMAAIPFGLIGTFVVVRRIGYLASAIAHCALGGIGGGLYLQYLLATTVFAAYCAPMVVAMTVTILAAVLIGTIQIYAKEREDTIIGVVWVTVMACGIILLDRTPGSGNIASYLFGDILLITHQDVLLVTALSVAVLTVVLTFFKRFEAVCFDPEFSQIRGVPTTRYFLLLLVLTAMTVVMLVQIVGVILLVAMLTLPAATACRWTKRLLPIGLLAILFGFLASWSGLLLSVWLHCPTGPTIVLVAASFYLVSLLKK